MHDNKITRRRVVIGLAALPVALSTCARKPADTMKSPQAEKESIQSKVRMPVIFAAHGAPILLEDAVWMSELRNWANVMPKPKGILMVSAHWEARPATLGATRTVPLVYDFSGFPDRYYQTKYPAPGAPMLATRVRDLLRAANIRFTDDAERGLDHGAYVPLLAMYPEADVPVLQLSMPVLNPSELVELGRALGSLRDEGVLIFGSGFLTHNMRFAFRPGIPTWAREFDEWVTDALTRFDVDALSDFQRKAPAAHTALPTWEHYAPVLVAVGAVADIPPVVTFPVTGFWMDGAFTRRSVQFG